MRAQLDLCAQRGITFRRWLGWEPRTWTRQLSDGRTETTTEPEYDPLERMLWRALSEYEATLCPGCRQPLDECLLDESVAPEDRPIYQAAHRTCLGCQALEAGQHQQERADEKHAKAMAGAMKRSVEQWLEEHPIARQARQWFVVRAR